ncbi:amidohydrolase family protein [Sinorhizobium medicae]|uniref:amidohydrolase family protein n=1 Tax=Sinorhizobium medicae TaxID=110321 RepID=UPI000FD83AA7|nr:amidohydrolase family protein [Sinorhizobium medicae]MDX0463508.1 amidohydrolase family protein [Sinorhizobium medicae]MDX0685846.1 amidohydrolase family protein [Sinorhizobium medicae]MDX0691751.1 amidohydrolase family protein [Sinorhizobium medicae]MDX0790219.1 amidohydrolase family protein [Sinorhizobium medicae]MDX0919228.1 amidohydrolase family protein [Sinorhizobium medicae]
MQANKRAYRGRVVQMDTTFNVFADGIVWIEANRIIAVADAGASKPVGFEHIQPVVTGGTIFPGLIELHNHLAYNVLRPWDVPKPYANREEWRDDEDYKAIVNDPMNVLGKSSGVAPAIARYTEAKCLLAGTTTSQGITLSSNLGMKRYYRGLIRNVEESLDSNLPDAKARIPNYRPKDKEQFLKDLKDYECFLLHLSEGIGDDARSYFLGLEIEPGSWAIAPSLTGIHCTALKAEDFERLAQNGAGMVWSPLSNLMLYGGTADIKVARAAGIRIALGSDWSPSGSKNLLHEMKMAWRYSEFSGGIFSRREIVAMSTISAAGLLRWDRYLGSLETGKYADLIVIRGDQSDPYEALLNADETSIDLVVVDGVPRSARPALAAGFSKTSELVAFANERRMINFDDAAADQAVAGLSLSAAEKILKEAMAGLGNPLAILAKVSPYSQWRADLPPTQEEWTIVLDEEEENGHDTVPQFDGSAKIPEILRDAKHTSPMAPLSTPLKPQELDKLTVAGDDDYYPSFLAQKNIPETIKLALFPGQ